jgi:hypothetical protein
VNSKLFAVSKKVKALRGAQKSFSPLLRETTQLAAAVTKKVKLFGKRSTPPAKAGAIRSMNFSKFTALTSAALTRYTAAGCFKRLPALRRRAAHRRNKFTRRRFTSLRRTLRTTNTTRNLIAAARTQAQTSLVPFTTVTTISAGATPLLFQRPTKLVVKSAAEKKRAVI